jgi:hypothetical protein
MKMRSAGCPASPVRLLFILLVLTANAGFPGFSAGQDLAATADLNLSGSGARAAGMGGAFIGVADDATAAMWNPAGLTQLERPEVSLVAKAVIERIEFVRAQGLLEPNETQSGHLVGDFASFVYPIRKGDRKLVVAISYQQLLDFFDSAVAFYSDRVSDVNFRGRGYAVAPVFALRLFGPLAVGGSLNFWSGDLDLKLRELNPDSMPPMVTAGSFDTDFSGTNGTFGMLIDFASRWPSVPVKVGAVYRQPFDLDFTTKFQLTVDSLMTEETAKGEVEMAWMSGIGGSIRIQQNVTLAADFERRRFSHSLVDLIGDDTTPAGSSGPAEETDEIRVGAEYALVKEKFAIPLRGGFRYSPAPDITGPGTPFAIGEAWTWATGAGFATPGFSIDGAVEMRRTEREHSAGVDKFRQLTLAFSGIVYF